MQRAGRLVIAAMAALLGLSACAPGFWPWQRPTRADRRAIEQRYDAWLAALHDERYADAYLLMSPEYRAGHSLAELAKGPWPDGQTWALRPGYSLWTKGSMAYLYPLDHDGWFELWNGPVLEWTKAEGDWFLTGKVTWYKD